MQSDFVVVILLYRGSEWNKERDNESKFVSAFTRLFSNLIRFSANSNCVVYLLSRIF